MQSPRFLNPVLEQGLLMLLLFAGACLGHLVLMIVSHNWWYGLSLPATPGHHSPNPRPADRGVSAGAPSDLGMGSQRATVVVRRIRLAATGYLYVVVCASSDSSPCR